MKKYCKLFYRGQGMPCPYRTVILFIAVFTLLFITPPAFTDTIHLKNGNKITGIIIKEDEEAVEIQINIGAKVTFSKQDIERIEKDSDVEHQKVEQAWQKEKEERQVEGSLLKKAAGDITTQEKERIKAANIAKKLDKINKEEKFSSKTDKKVRSDFANKLLEKGDWYVRETEHFSIFYTDRIQAKIISDKAEYYFEKIIYDLGYENQIKWKKKCQVYIVESTDRWKRFLKKIGFNPDLVGGFIPNYESKEMYLCALSDGYLVVTFPHELTHLIFRDIAGKSTIPLWLNEGLANYEASATSFSNELLVEYIKNGKHILLGDLLRIASYPVGKEIRELFYAQSGKLVAFLITQHGRKKFRKFCELILKDKSFKESLLRAYKEDFEDLEDFNIKLVEYIVK